MEAGDTGKEPAKPVEEPGTPEKEAPETAKAAHKPSPEPDEKPDVPSPGPTDEPAKSLPKAKKAVPKPTPKPVDRRKLLRWGIVALALLVAVIAWVATRDSGGGSSESSSSEPAAPRIVTVDELREAAETLGQPIYWAGPVKGKELELKELSEGGVQVLYLPEGTAAGAGSAAKSLTIGSYPLADPASAVKGFGERKGSTVRHASDGREVATSSEAPSSVYFTSPDNSVQVEVYDPSAQKAMSLALSGRVQPVG